MTDLNRLFRTGAAAGIFTFAALSLACAAVAQSQTPAPAMPRPRYQSPGVPQVEGPKPQFSLPMTPSITPNARVVEDVIVRVNDQVISRSDVERAAAQMQQETASNNSEAPTDLEDRRKNLLRDLIDQQLLLSKGKELAINADAEVIRRLDEIRKQNNFPTMEALETAARAQGVSFEDFKANIRNSIITSSVVRDEVGRTIKMSNAEQMKYYEAHKGELNQPEQVRLSEILVPTAADADDASVAAALKSSQGIYAKLQAGGDFAAIAKQSSGGPTAAQGGDLGLFKHGALAAVLEQKTFGLPVGSYTEPTRTRQGYVILKVTEHQQAGVPPFEQVQSEVQNAMYQEAIQPALRAYLTKLREEAFIDIRPGFVDSGASPRQTKPVFAAYVPPAPKKVKAAKSRLDAGSGRMATAAVAKTGSKAAVAAPAVAEVDKHGKPKKVKREKIRLGQAPRTALPDAPEGLDAADAGGSVMAAGSGTTAAPGTAIRPLETSNTVAANAAPEDPLETSPARPTVKTRYASREVEVKQKKASVKTAKVVERAKATPIAASADEKATAKAQADALGLNGSNAKKQKVKRKKGDPKDRLQEKAVEPKAPLRDNGLPEKLHQINGPEKPTTETKKPTSDTTTLAPADQPAPGSLSPSPVPSSNGGVTPTGNAPVPQTPGQPQ